MSESYLVNYLRLRLLVGYLGERSQFDWWSTSFFEASSKSFLEPAFPKTFLLAQYHGITEAARKLHDGHIGTGRVSHLFRLPEEFEHDLHSLMREQIVTGQSFAPIRNKELAIQSLFEIAEVKGQTSEGPIAIGTLNDIRKATKLQRLGQVYLAAFEQRIRSYPYLAG